MDKTSLDQKRGTGKIFLGVLRHFDEGFLRSKRLFLFHNHSVWRLMSGHISLHLKEGVMLVMRLEKLMAYGSAPVHLG